MIIYGTRGLTSTPETGSFHCPRCGPQKHYALKRVRRWFTLYFIPVIPLDRMGEYIECLGCAGEFGVDAIHYQPDATAVATANPTATIEEIKRLLILAAASFNPPDARAEGAAREQFSELTGSDIAPEKIHEELVLARSSGMTLVAYAPRAAHFFPPEGKEFIFTGVYHVLTAAGPLNESSRSMLRQFGTALGMTLTQTDAVLAQVGG